MAPTEGTKECKLSVYLRPKSTDIRGRRCFGSRQMSFWCRAQLASVLANVRQHRLARFADLGSRRTRLTEHCEKISHILVNASDAFAHKRHTHLLSRHWRARRGAIGHGPRRKMKSGPP